MKTKNKQKQIPVVAIGASAGSIAAFEKFFSTMPVDLPAAIVIIQHLAPTHDSMLLEVVQRFTQMDVKWIENRVPVKQGKVYINPPNKEAIIKNGKLLLSLRTELEHKYLPIDTFFRSLKTDLKEKAIAIVFSGTGSDGASGIKEVKEAGGLTLVQSPETAQYDGMPISAISTGIIDFILPVHEMPIKIANYLENEFGEKKVFSLDIEKNEQYINQIFAIIKNHLRHDFSNYKRNTIFRRIERRMSVREMKNLPDYIELLRKDTTEIVALHKELLISVTNFFRDIEIFESIYKNLVPEIVKQKTGNKIRIWVPACATGEEAYSIAILFRQYFDVHKIDAEVQIFASDIDLLALQKAREGIYAGNIMTDVPQDLLDVYFTKDKNGFKIKKQIREMIIFAEQHVLQDPPYSKMDMVSCRNFLIYLNSEWQQKAIAIFHYALNIGGFLVLGNSESLGNLTGFFTMYNRRLKIFNKIESKVISGKIWSYIKKIDTSRPEIIPEKIKPASQLADIAKKMILDRFTPASVVINQNADILYIQGRTGKFLEYSTGEVSNNILNIAREGLKIALSNAIRKTKVSLEETIIKNLKVKTNGNYEYVDVIVAPVRMQNETSDLMLVIFQSIRSIEPIGKSILIQTDNLPKITELEKELHSTQEYLQSTIEELETTNEELKSTNEEAQSTNEELQSSNEELETSKEELQSVNEELITANHELQHKMEELGKVNNVLANLFTSTKIATLFLDKQLRIFRFTPAISKFIDLLETDIGRSIQQFTNTLEYNKLIEDCKEVLETLLPRELEVQRSDQLCFWMRILPYRTLEDTIEGVVITFTDITARRNLEGKFIEAKQKVEESEEKFRLLTETASVGIFLTDLNGKCTYVNEKWCEMAHISHEQAMGDGWVQGVYEEDRQKIFENWQTMVSTSGNWNLEYRLGNQNKITWVYGNAKTYCNNAGEIVGYVGANTDVTIRKYAEEQLIKNNEELKKINETKSKFFSIIAHDLKSPFNALQGYSSLLLKNIRNYDIEKIEKHIQIIQNVTNQTINLLEDLLSWSRSQLGNIPFNPQKISFSDCCQLTISALQPVSNVKEIRIEHFAANDIFLLADVQMVQTILRNLITNAIKFTPFGGKIDVFAMKVGSEIEITISDTGIGMDETKIVLLFDPAKKISTAGTDGETGTGLGLLLCKEFVEKHCGKIWVESEVGIGSEFHFTMPLCKT